MYLVLFAHPVLCQSIEQSAVYRYVENENFLRIHYENDIFNSTDEYYSQGVNLELIHPVLKNNFLNNLLIKPKNCMLSYSISLEHNIFTPENIRMREIVIDDRPYASCLMLKSTVSASKPENVFLLVSTLSIGAIGHLSNGDCLQIYLHKRGSNITPKGWNNQVKNDFILNYQVNYNRKIIDLSKSSSLTASGELRIGTLYDRIGTGLVFMAGQLNNLDGNNKKIIFMGLGKKNGIKKLYFYSETYVHFISYDATLQGGLFNKQSPYTIGSSEIERVVLGNNSGIVMSINNLYIEYFYSFLSKEFKAGNIHFWGGLKIGFTF